MSQPSNRYRARIDEAEFNIDLSEAGASLGGDGRSATLRHVSGNAYVLVLDGKTFRVTMEQQDGAQFSLRVNGTRLLVDVSDAQRLLLESFGLGGATGAGQREVKAPMPGLVLAVRVEPGQLVEAGDGLLVLEAMKMENEIKAAHRGVISRVHVETGQAVTKNALLIEFEA